MTMYHFAFRTLQDANDRIGPGADTCHGCSHLYYREYRAKAFVYRCEWGYFPGEVIEHARPRACIDNLGE